MKIEDLGPRRVRRTPFAAAMTLCLAACGGGGGGAAAPPAAPATPFDCGAVGNLLAEVRSVASGAIAVYDEADPPAPTGDGPALTVIAAGGGAPGGTTLVRVQADAGLDALVLSDPASTGHWRLPLDGTTAELDLLVTLGPDPCDPNPSFAIAAISGPTVTEAQLTALELVDLAPGDARVTLQWPDITDLDLIVVEPGGFQLGPGATASPDGGVYQLDSNIGCLQAFGVEHAYWPAGNAAPGAYQVFVANSTACALETPFAVTIEVGEERLVVTGTAGPPSGSSQFVTEFVVP